MPVTALGWCGGKAPNVGAEISSPCPPDIHRDRLSGGDNFEKHLEVNARQNAFLEQNLEFGRYGLRMMGRGQTAWGREQRAEGREQRAEGREQRAEGREQRAEGREQRAKSRGQRAESREQRAESKEQWAEGKEQKAWRTRATEGKVNLRGYGNG